MLRRNSERLNKMFSEIAKLNSLALAPFLTNTLDYAFLMVDLVMLGHLGKGQLAPGIVGFAARHGASRALSALPLEEVAALAVSCIRGAVAGEPARVDIVKN
jgi:hypothetical protein